jgi:hypothetical protein
LTELESSLLLKHKLTLLFIIWTILAFSQGESLELAASLNTLSEIHSAKQSNDLFVTGRSYLETGLSFTLKTDKSRWKLFSNIGLISGSSISDRIGDIYLASSIDAQNTFRMQNLWLGYENERQTIQIRIGNQAVDDLFMVSDRSNFFIHGAAAYVFTFSMNAPQWPVASFGLSSSLSLSTNQILSFGIYGSDPEVTDEFINTNGFQIRSNYTGALKIIEWQKTNDQNLLKLGFFSDNNRFGFYEGLTSSLNAFYAVKEGLLNASTSRTQLSYHLGFSRALNDQTAPINYDIRASIFAKPTVWKKEMTFALGYFYPHINKNYLNDLHIRSESFGELSVSLLMNKNMTFQLSSQYIQGAGAIEGLNLDSSVLGVARLYFSL